MIYSDWVSTSGSFVKICFSCYHHTRSNAYISGKAQKYIFMFGVTYSKKLGFVGRVVIFLLFFSFFFFYTKSIRHTETNFNTLQLLTKKLNHLYRIKCHRRCKANLWLFSRQIQEIIVPEDTWKLLKKIFDNFLQIHIWVRQCMRIS